VKKISDRIFTMRLATLIRKVRLSSDVSCTDLAKGMRVSETRLNRIESGTCTIYASEFFRFCEAMNVSPDTLLQGAKHRLYRSQKLK